MSDNGGPGNNSPWGDEKLDLGKFKKDMKLPDKVPGGSFIAIILVLIYLGSGFFIVKPNEEAVVKRFGKISRVVGSGPHYHLPWPVETIDKAVVTKVHRLEIGFRTSSRGSYQGIPKEAQMLTGDENIVNIDMSLQYRITQIENFLYNVTRVETTIKDVAESTIREVAGREMIDDILTTGKNRIQNETLIRMQEILDYYKAGVDIVAVQLQDVSPPDEVVASFKDVASAREDKNRFINEAEAYQNEVIPQARGKAEAMIQEAEGYRREKVEKAIGDTSRFNNRLEAYVKSPEVTRKRMYLDTMEQVLSKTDKFIFDDQIDNLSPFLGLEKLGGAK
ncbi:FtsH protease activity modulator HflK [Limisalsivibrio acetivorans]|uniref:FtsH protease activity modulator HflK n=1 Tax=Limisalsivibrio acetivorans TaxID=1304888 RepID=UPI0003B5A39D|nr:FtsH protease activity modulator HflK [Limisalsivibrio acetivorans]